jgi:hypothetical protein
MAVEQNFYPSFFEKSLKGTSGTTFASNGSLLCKMRLYGAGGAFTSTDTLVSDLSDPVGAADNVTVTLTKDGDILKFSVESAAWNAPGTFKYAVLATSTDDYLFMHFNLNSGADITPAGLFTLSMTSNEEPQINFVPA